MSVDGNRIEAHHISPSSWTFLRTEAHAGFFTSTSHTLHVTGDVKRPAEDCRLSSGRQSWLKANSSLADVLSFLGWEKTQTANRFLNQTFSSLSALDRTETSSWLDSENVAFWNVPVKIGLWNVSLSSVWIWIVWLSKSGGLWKARSDNLELTFEIWLWKFEWQLDLESFASLKIWRWKLDLKFDVWNLSFEIGLWQKFDFGNFSFDLWFGLLTKVDFWKLTVVEMSLWKVDFCLVLHEFFDLWLKMLRPETATIKQKQLSYCLLPGLT